MATEDTLRDKEKLIREEQQLNAAVEDLRTKLNAVIAARQLKPILDLYEIGKEMRRMRQEELN